ncbi:MAG: lamin tail domain-containing protein [Candidatus Tenebribacter mawsonii]|nr:lamin tail domain-containing protein [Candidatus Tenebribacter mawsonii]
MKKFTIILFTFLMALAFNGWGQTTINNVTFESAGGYTSSIIEFTDGDYDFFIRTDGTNIGGGYSVSNIQGSYFFGAQDIDGEGAALPVTLTIDDVNISGYTDLQLKVYLAEDDDGINQDWDGADYVHFDYDIDNSGSFTDLLWIESSITGTNGEPKIDTDYDGLGDGTSITNTFVQFTQNITGTGSLIDIKITFFLNNGDEDIAIDNIELVGLTQTITLSTSSLTGFTYEEGSGPSSEQSFTAEGSNLTADISIAATTNYEISTGTGGSFSATNPITLTQSGGSVASTPIYVRLKAGLAVGDYNSENITATSTDATNKTVTCNGTVTYPEPTSGDLIITEVNSTSSPNATYVEIYNTTDSEINLEKVDLEHYNNGSATVSATLNLTGTINAKSYIVISRGISEFNLVYSFDPDFQLASMYLNGGLDGLILRHDDNEILDSFNDVPNSTVSWTDNHLFYRFDYSSSGLSLADDWDDSGINMNGTPKAKNELTWKTSGTIDWGIASNWSNGDEPSKGVDVIIPSGGSQPTADGTTSNPVQCMNLTINSDAILTIKIGGYMTVNGTLTNNAGSTGLVLNSDASGTGSLITNGIVSGSATVQRYIPGYSSKGTTGFHFLSSPVQNQLISTEFVDVGNIPSTTDFYLWNEVHNYWINIKEAESGTYNQGTSWENFSNDANPLFISGNGYMVGYTGNITKSFSGTPHTGNMSSGTDIPAITYTINEGNGWNLIGNPYPSAIDWDNGTWLRTRINGSVYIYKGSTGDYISWNGTTGDLTDGVIPAMHGFFVKADEASASLTIPNASRVHSTSTSYKSSKNTENVLVLQVTKNGLDNRVYLQFTSNASELYDTQYDAYKLFGTGNSPQIYSMSGDNVKLSINALPEITNELIVPINLKVITDGEHQISIYENTIISNVSLFLEDKFENETINLSKLGSYSFTCTTNNNPDRFLLHVKSASGINENDNNNFDIYSNNSTIYIINPKFVDANVVVYNLVGQEIDHMKINGDEFKSFQFDVKQGYYIVKVISDQSISTEKVYIK